jgi:hypothetical protein
MLNLKQGSVQAVHTLSAVCSHPATPASGDPVRIGELTGSALTAERSDGTTTVVIGRHIATHSVKGVDAGGNSAVAIGDVIYYVDADTPVLSKKVAGRKFGIALEAVGAGATATIRVLVGGGIN